VSEESGDALVGELTEGLVDLVFQGGEGGGITGELFGPCLLLPGKGGLHIGQRLIHSRNSFALLVAESKQHDRLLPRLSALLTAYGSEAVSASLSGTAPVEPRLLSEIEAMLLQL
jgi:hypothetical protein